MMTDEQQAAVTHLDGLLSGSHPDIGNDELRMPAAERDAIAYALKLVKREALVEDVIRLSNAYLAALKAGSYGAEAEENLYQATRRLAEWKP